MDRRESFALAATVLASIRRVATGIAIASHLPDLEAPCGDEVLGRIDLDKSKFILDCSALSPALNVVNLPEIEITRAGLSRYTFVLSDNFCVWPVSLVGRELRATDHVALGNFVIGITGFGNSDEYPGDKMMQSVSEF